MQDCDTTTVGGSSSGSAAASTSDQTKDNIGEKLKVLALHGYRQTGESFKAKLGAFRKYLAKYVDFVFITAPHVAPFEGDNPGNSWWFKDDGTFKGSDKCAAAIGFEESLKLVEEVWETQGPFQGIMGFSQGASFTGLICSLASRGMTKINPRFAVMASGFKSQSLAHRSYYESKIGGIQSFHIYGETDEIIPPSMSLDLASMFVEPIVEKHKGGHYFPATVDQKYKYILFFRDQLQDYLEAKEIAERVNLLDYSKLPTSPQPSEESEENMQKDESEDSVGADD
uniref:CSON008440 protein n=1 Tax=Culicoides sonorensis TaxID=179676 RepID=A0A336LJZ1_CULSO